MALKSILEEYFGIMIGNAMYSVDVFLFFGGFFLSYSLLHGSKSSEINNPFNFFKLVAFRWLRIAPTYGLIILASIKILPLVGSDSVYYYNIR